jgi:hypothetical protein
MSRELLDRLFPNRDNTPSNYRLKRDPSTGVITIYYEPTGWMIGFLGDEDNKEEQIIEYLLENGVQIEEAPFGS